jgi:hypothetical protein
VSDVLTPRQRAFLEAYEAAEYGDRYAVAMDHGFEPSSAYKAAHLLRKRLREAGLPVPARQTVRERDLRFLQAYEAVAHLPREDAAEARERLAERRGISLRSAHRLVCKVRQKLREAA